ncbi:MAG: immunoglobulin domain-containing protein, partial [Planctomycetota bacterium]|nr:immunoglobulin domain-containing protein [Planctomycetota bacterium]
PITGQISPSIEILAASLADTGSYDCVVSNARGGVASSSAQLTVTDSALITVQPFNRVVCTGGATTFSVTAIAPGTIAYQWRRDGFPVANGNAPTLIISNASAANIGTYDCVLTSSCGSATTSAATLQVVTPPSITQQPAPAIACTGSSASFTVAATGAAPFTYRWRKDGINVPGGTQQTLVLSNISAANAGVYDCIVSNACGSATSTGASLRIPGSVTQQPESLATCSGGNFSLSIAAAEATGYQWFKDGQPLANGARPSGAVVSGATSPTLNLSSVALTESGEYRCQVTSACTPVFSATAQVTISDPTIRAHWTGPIASPTGEYPQGIVGSSMVFDSTRGLALLFGGRRGSTLSNQTWVWNNSEWAQALPADRPPARSDAAMAFSPSGGVTLLVGGQGATDLLADAWLWDGSNWLQVGIPSGLTKRRGSALAFDEIRGVFVLFGGYGQRPDLSIGLLNDTWEFNRSAWVRRSTPTAPAAREQAGLSFMLGQDTCILHGGSGGSGVLGDTWSWNGSVWAQVPGVGPAARAKHAQAFDPRRGVVRVFGGHSAAATALSDVWEFDGSTWSQVPTGSVGAGARSQMASAYDTVRGKQIIWGGQNSAGQQVEQLWSMSMGVFGLSEQPIAAASCQGTGLTLRVAPATPGVYTYQWLRSGQLISDSEFVTGTNTASLV